MTQKEFDTWNDLKKKIDLNNLPLFYPQEKEVWFINLGKNIGFEQNGVGDDFARPVLILKRFNNKMFWVIPLSSKQKNFDFYHNFMDPEVIKFLVF